MSLLITWAPLKLSSPLFLRRRFALFSGNPLSADCFDARDRDCRAVSPVPAVPAVPAAAAATAVSTADFHTNGPTAAVRAAGPAAVSSETGGAAAATVPAVPAGGAASETNKTAAVPAGTRSARETASTGKKSEYFSHTNTLIILLHAWRAVNWFPNSSKSNI